MSILWDETRAGFGTVWQSTLARELNLKSMGMNSKRREQWR